MAGSDGGLLGTAAKDENVCRVQDAGVPENSCHGNFAPGAVPVLIVTPLLVVLFSYRVGEEDLHQPGSQGDLPGDGRSFFRRHRDVHVLDLPHPLFYGPEGRQGDPVRARV